MSATLGHESLFAALEVVWGVTDLTWHYVMLQFNITVGGTPHILYCRIVVGHRYYITLCDVTSYILYNITPHITIDDKNENVCRVTDGLGRDWFEGTMKHYIITYCYITRYGWFMGGASQLRQRQLRP